MSRPDVDAEIRALAELGCETWQDLTPENRRRLVRAYFEQNGEWGDALYERMEPVFDALEHHDDADFGLAVRQKLTAYVWRYVEKRLKYERMCIREREELTA